MIRTRDFLVLTGLVVTALGGQACTCIARSPEQYRDDTSALLSERNTQIKNCYDSSLAQNPNLSGKLTVKFTVEKKTGVVKDVNVDTTATTVPTALGDCVAGALDGLKLAPEDRRQGDATFVWEFRSSNSASAPS